MRKIQATGFEHVHAEDRPTLFVSNGRGNSGQPEVHLHFFDSALEQEVQGWFPVSELLAAIKEGGE